MNRVFWIDLIRVVGALFVIAIHVSGRAAGGYETSGETLTWLFSRCYHELSHVAVPLFIMISGALLLERNDEPLPFYRKRFGKILMPFFAWCCIYLFCRYITGQRLQDETLITWLSSVGAILSRNISGHFWFMYLLISLYLAAPFLAVFVRNASKNTLFVFFALWLFAVVFYPVVNNVAKETWGIEKIDFRFEFISYWVGFFIAGYILKGYTISKRQIAIAVILWFFLSLANPVNAYLQAVSSEHTVVSICSFLGTYVFSITSHQSVVSLLAFLVLRSLGEISSFAASRFGQMISFIAPLTFGVYLSHMLFVLPVMRVAALESDTSWLVILCGIPILTILIYAASGGMIYLIRKVRYLKFLAP